MYPYSEKEKAWYIKREQDEAKGDIKIVKMDFFDDLPRAVCEVLDRIRWRWKNYDWFEEAWNKYREHVINACASGLPIKAPGFIFNDYIDDQVKEDFLNRSELEFMHSEDNLDVLFHHGIKGQRWGVRRYQNEDGSLTSAGQARYNSDGTKKDPKKMSDEDLRKSNQRLQSEQLYKQLRDRDNPSKEAGKTALTALVATGATFAATYAGSRIWAKATGDSKLDRGKSVLLALLASIGTGAGVIGGRVGQVNVKEAKK